MSLRLMGELFEQFLKERRYPKNVTNKTIIWYLTGVEAFMRIAKVTAPAQVTRQTLQAFVIGLREKGIAPVTCNTYAKAVNAFLKWLHDEGHVSSLLVIPPQRVEKRVLQIWTEAQLRTLLTFKAKSLAQHRVAPACNPVD